MSNIGINTLPDCVNRIGDYCNIASQYFGKPITVSNLWCNGTCKQHKGPFNNRNITPKQELLFALRLFLRNYASHNDEFMKRVVASFDRQIDVKLNWGIYCKIKDTLNISNKLLLTGSLVTKDSGHKDYDVVIIVKNIAEVDALRAKLPASIDGVKMDYFFLLKPGTSFYAVTLDLEELTLYRSAWSNMEIKVSDEITIVEAVTNGADKILKEMFQDRRLSINDALKAIKALLLYPKVSLEEQTMKETICAGCDYGCVKDSKYYCGVCKCNTEGNVSITSVEENLPEWGCKHPQRKQGKGWPLQ